MAYTTGLDYGTNLVRCVIVDTTDGREVGTAAYNYLTEQAVRKLRRNCVAQYHQKLYKQTGVFSVNSY